MSFVQQDLQDLGGQILAWYTRHQRDFPWRKTRDPYHVWISEVMLQQTQVETVIPYYYRFLSRFPTVQALAAAPLDDVLKVWENMGYYARAHHLHAAAKQIVGRFGGKIPSSWDELVSLPGVGHYTAGAVLSMAFGQHVPAVDSNVRRVLSRLFAIDQPLEQRQTQQQLVELAKRLLPEDAPGLFNQALMDLGASTCTPRKPACMSCPIWKLCKAYERQLQDALPVTRKRIPIPHSHMTAGLIHNSRGRILIVRRPNKGLLGGLWKFPGGVQESDETLVVSLQRQVREEVGIKIQVGKPLTSVNHAYTHFRITLHAFQCTYQAGKPRSLGCTDWRWTTLPQLKDLALSKADRKIIEVLRSERSRATA